MVNIPSSIPAQQWQMTNPFIVRWYSWISPFEPPLLWVFRDDTVARRHDVAVDLRDVLPLLRKGGGEELGKVLLEEREDQDVPHRRQGDDEDDQKGNPFWRPLLGWLMNNGRFFGFTHFMGHFIIYTFWKIGQFIGILWNPRWGRRLKTSLKPARNQNE